MTDPSSARRSRYPPEVETVIAVEPELLLRRIAEDNAAQAAVTIQVIPGTAEHLPASDASCDAAVLSLVQCTIPDVPAALAEVTRVLKPGGQIRFLEHIRSPHPAAYSLQRLFDLTLWPFLNGGCYSSRDTVATLINAGFLIDDQQRLTGTGIPFPASPQILGVATAPTREQHH